MRRISRSNALSIAVVGAMLAGTLVTGLFRSDVRINALDVVLPLIASAGVLLRRRYPVATLILVSAAVVIYYPYARLDGPMIVLPFVMLYTAADQGHLIAAIATGASTLLVMGLGETTSDVRHVEDGVFVMIAGWVVAAVAAGGVTRNRRAYMQEAEQRLRELEHSREEEARRRAGEERLRIARELHDVLGHNISMINVQASAALRGIRKRPEDAEAALRTIKDTSKETLRELRTTLGVLRQVDEAAPTAPADSLARVDALVAASGLDVRTELSGPLDEVPTEVDLAATRIIREALTNVTRHSGTGAATVSVASASGEIEIRVDDDGPGAVYTEGSGFGLQGMRERAAALGGTLEAGPRPEGGFRVLARLPLEPVKPS
ncbi:sensor histidine kinase [Nonomuraea sp. NN258]|uniref:sensor histidine kinase n=1 Tax=Nonomuraea antri TaxID=2730852 RepID=UPI00156A234E|nr:sensor histidine kinase [Nonomuraea antri]NRQ37264.1 sensor histidine kinase [Nonomuraea antri]